MLAGKDGEDLLLQLSILGHAEFASGTEREEEDGDTGLSEPGVEKLSNSGVASGRDECSLEVVQIVRVVGEATEEIASGGLNRAVAPSDFKQMDQERSEFIETIDEGLGEGSVAEVGGGDGGGSGDVGVVVETDGEQPVSLGCSEPE